MDCQYLLILLNNMNDNNFFFSSNDFHILTSVPNFLFYCVSTFVQYSNASEYKHFCQVHQRVHLMFLGTAYFQKTIYLQQLSLIYVLLENKESITQYLSTPK